MQTLWQGDDPRTNQFCRQFSKLHWTIGYICTRALVQSNQPNEAMVVHPGYYQKDVLDIKYNVPSFNINITKIRRGQILQIFHEPSLSHVTKIVIEGLVNEFNAHAVPSRTFPNLLNINKSAFGKICATSGLIFKGRVVDNLISYEALLMRNWTTASSAEKKKFMLDFFTKIPR